MECLFAKPCRTKFSLNRYCHTTIQSLSSHTDLDRRESVFEVLDAADGHVVNAADDNDDERHKFEAGEKGVEAGGPLDAPAVQDGEEN